MLMKDFCLTGNFVVKFLIKKLIPVNIITKPKKMSTSEFAAVMKKVLALIRSRETKSI